MIGVLDKDRALVQRVGRNIWICKITKSITSAEMRRVGRVGEWIEGKFTEVGRMGKRTQQDPGGRKRKKRIRPASKTKRS